MVSGLKKKAILKKSVWDYYGIHKRNQLPWRKKITPYRIWISEVMLQQTQADRVIGFFNEWMKQFPTIEILSNAPQSEILKLWKGLGYNSRALRIKKTAEIIMKDYRGIFPKTYNEILMLPGIGPYTAGAISAFAYNRSIEIIETNIRRVYIHHFFSDKKSIHDKDLLPLIKETVDDTNPREWYWALMDYGSHLSKVIPNPNKKSRHYTVQKKFKGSDRQIRGKILEILLEKNTISINSIFEKIQNLSSDNDRIEIIISAMEQEGFLTIKKDKIILKR
jgi:A/G-specific adenine glycosylase